MDDELADRFERERPRLRAVARRMLGSATEADDAVQETWLRLARTDGSAVDNLPAWLTTVLTRVCLNVLRARTARREDPLEDHGVRPEPEPGPEDAVLLNDAVGVALQVVLDTMSPRERVAFVLHDVFAVPFEEIGPMLDSSPAAVRQLASRARRRVRELDPADVDPVRQRELADAFFAAARAGDLDRLTGLLDPDVLLRADFGPGRGQLFRGNRTVAGRAASFEDPTARIEPVRVGDRAAAVVRIGERVHAVFTFTVAGGVITEIDALTDRDRLARLD